MSQVLILACGNTLRGDDGVALVVVRYLLAGFCDPQIQIKTTPQWTPELAELLNDCETVIFVDASVLLAPGEILLKGIVPVNRGESQVPLLVTPAEILALAEKLYARVPEHAFTLSIGGQSFGDTNQLSLAVRQAIPEAIDQIKALLSGVSLPSAPSVV